MVLVAITNFFNYSYSRDKRTLRFHEFGVRRAQDTLSQIQQIMASIFFNSLVQENVELIF